MIRKLLRSSHKIKNDSGIIIIIVLWAMVILTTLVVSLGRNTSIELSLTKYALGDLKAKYLAWAGLNFAMNQIKIDSDDQLSNSFDNLYYCAISSSQEDSTEQLFKHKELGQGYFDIRYVYKGSSGAQKLDFYGMQDEERKININTLNNVAILNSLLEILGVDATTAQTISYSILDWKDADKDLSQNNFGAEDEYYTGQTPSYHCKNAPFDSLEELLLVRGMTKEIYSKVKDYLTVFPKDGPFVINFNTASKTVLQSVARWGISQSPTNDVADADSLVDNILRYRAGDDLEDGTKDDRSINVGQFGLGLNAKEGFLFSVISQMGNEKSNYIRVSVLGVDNASHVKVPIEAVIRRDDFAIIDWRRF